MAKTRPIKGILKPPPLGVRLSGPRVAPKKPGYPVASIGSPPVPPPVALPPTTPVPKMDAPALPPTPPPVVSQPPIGAAGFNLGGVSQPAAQPVLQPSGTPGWSIAPDGWVVGPDGYARPGGVPTDPQKLAEIQNGANYRAGMPSAAPNFGLGAAGVGGGILGGLPKGWTPPDPSQIPPDLKRLMDASTDTFVKPGGSGPSIGMNGIGGILGKLGNYLKPQGFRPKAGPSFMGNQFMNPFGGSNQFTIGGKPQKWGY